jgi:hypothetical protein
MVRLVEQGALSQLAQDSAFSGRVAEDVGAVISLTIRYLARRLDHPAAFMRADFDEENVVERHLADDFEDWLALAELGRGTVTTEVRRVAAGRVDVLVAFGTHRVVVELKRELTDASREALETHYADQAASYQATDYPFGLVLVLDLTPERDSAIAHLEDLVWVSKAHVPGRDRWLVWNIVPGRRGAPSELSR